jgi:hypothetical protein
MTAAAQPDDETMSIQAHICFAAHGVKNCSETDPEWCRCYRHPGHHGEHRCECGHRWDAQPCPCGCETREASR